MEKKYKHPWLPYPYAWVLVLVSVWLLFVNGGYVVIIILWTYKIAYYIIAPISWANRKERRLIETEQAIRAGEPCVFSKPDDVIEDYGLQKGIELLQLAHINNSNTLEAKEKTLKDFKEYYIRKTYLDDCKTWDDVWHGLTSMPWVTIRNHNKIEQLLGCPDPSNLMPVNLDTILSGIRKEKLSQKEIEIINNNEYSDKKKGGLDTSKLPKELLDIYKHIAYELVPWGMTYEEKEKKMNTFKMFNKDWNKDISILGLKEQDLKTKINY